MAIAFKTPALKLRRPMNMTKTYQLPIIFLLAPAANAFSTAFARPQTVVARPALIYMPDGETVEESSDDWMEAKRTETPSDILEYLNGPDLRGPLAILAAAHASIEISTIEHVQVNAVTESAIRIEALCSREDMTCVNVLASIDFPVSCTTDSEIIDALGVLHEQASAVLEQRKIESKLREETAPLAHSVLVDDQHPTAEPDAAEKIQLKPWEDESLSLSERAFAVLLDLGMIELTPDPSDEDYDNTKDDELCPENVWLQ